MIEKANTQLERESQALFANLRSEFSTPLDVIIGYSEILLKEASEYHMQEYTSDLQHMLEAGIQLQKSVNDTLDLALIQGSEGFDFQQFSSDLYLALLTPLSTVVGVCELILEEPFTSAQCSFQEDLEKIHQAGKVFRQYVEDIQRLSLAQRAGGNLLDQFKDSSIVIHDVVTSIPPLEQTHEKVTIQGKVLIVDDNEMSRNLMARRLQYYGLEVVQCDHGSKVLAMLQKEPVDAILLTIVMNEVNGYQVLKEIKKSGFYQDIPVIVLSSLKEIDSVVRCIELGASDYLSKPLNPVILKSRITDAIEKKQLHDKEIQYVEALKKEREKSENLLLNTLPKAAVERLKKGDKRVIDEAQNVTILFMDIVKFSTMADKMTTDELVDMLNQMFTLLDQLAEKHGVEKIKTIGDAYMLVSGVPERTTDHAERIANFALDVLASLNKIQSKEAIQVRIGVHSGPVMAGIIGTKKFVYDLWGRSVNLASRMESHGEANKIQVSETTYALLKGKYNFHYRGEIEVKNMGPVKAYFLLSIQ